MAVGRGRYITGLNQNSLLVMCSLFGSCCFIMGVSIMCFFYLISPYEFFKLLPSVLSSVFPLSLPLSFTSAFSFLPYSSSCYKFLPFSLFPFSLLSFFHFLFVLSMKQVLFFPFITYYDNPFFSSIHRQQCFPSI